MKLKAVDEHEVEKLPVLRHTEHHESDIRICNQETLYKILLFDSRLTREETVHRLCYYENEDCIVPREVLYNDVAEFIGFSMRFLHDYEITRNIIFKDLPYETRMEIAKNLIRIVEGFEKDDLVYWDVHPDNAMVKGTDVKLIDMDSIKYKDTCTPDDFIEQQKRSHKKLALVALSFLSKMDMLQLSKACPPELLKGLFENAFQGHELSQYLEPVFDYPTEVIYPSDFITHIKEKDLAACKNILVKKLRK